MRNTPDYRGVFLRGIGGNAAGLGQLQGDAIRNITGDFSLTIVDNYQERASGAFSLGNHFARGDNNYVDAMETYVVNFDVSRVVPTANENRPINKAVRYFIKAK